jgi:branched-chain amino acid transport system substrate-binding protein
LTSRGDQRVAVFFSSQSEYSQSIKSEFTTAMLGDGGDVVAEFDLSAPGFDAAAAVQTAQAQQAQALMLSGDVNTLAPSLQVIAANRRQLPLIGNDDMYTPKLLQTGGENALGMVVAVPWHVLSHLQSPFVQTSRQLWGGDVSWRTAMAYDATQTLIAALTQEPTRAGVQRALKAASLQIPGATSAVRFFPSGDRNQPDQLVKVERGPRSGYGYDFVPLSP